LGKGVWIISGALVAFFGGINMVKDVPFIAHMIIVHDEIFEKSEKRMISDKSYYNPEYDSNCEYCMNTSSWD
jgi:hypothetical protein